MAIIDVICAVIIDGDKVLVAQRSNNMSLPLKWEFPGGKLHSGETEEECVLRELKEELNIDIKIIARFAVSKFEYGSDTINLISFISTHESGQIQLSEHQRVEWKKRSDLADLDWAPADIPIVHKLICSHYI